MANTLQATAVTLLARASERLLLSEEERAWIRAIGADPMFADYPPRPERESCDGLEDVRREERLRRECLMALASAVVEDRRLGSPEGDHLDDLGIAYIKTSLAAAIVEFCTAMEAIAFQRGMARGRRDK